MGNPFYVSTVKECCVCVCAYVLLSGYKVLPSTYITHLVTDGEKDGTTVRDKELESVYRK